MNTVIFLGGEQGSGKSTAAAHIQSALQIQGFSVFILKYADTIYALHDNIEKQFSKIIGREPLKKNGPLLQILGTEIGRNLYDKDIWIMATEAKIRGILKTVSDGCTITNQDSKVAIIVEDVRFKNEFDLSAKLDADGIKTITMYFDAPEAVRKERVESFRNNTSHQSEAELSTFRDMFKYKVITDRSMQEKAEQLNKILDDENLLVSPKDSLSEIVGDINYLLTEWAKSTGFGANFEWRYTPEGIKELHIRDVAPIKSLPKDQAAVAVAEVQKVMEKLDGE